VGLDIFPTCPGVETPGYFHLSLRDETRVPNSHAFWILSVLRRHEPSDQACEQDGKKCVFKSKAK